MSADPIFQPLHFRNLTVKNRLFRSSLSGRFDHYDGTGTDLRIEWDVQFAKNGVGTIISNAHYELTFKRVNEDGSPYTG